MNPHSIRSALITGLLAVSASATALSAQTFPVLAADTPAGSGVVEPCEIRGAEGTARCGRFRVWEDRAARSGRTVDIAFVILDALERPEGPVEAVIPLPGGPGQAFTPAAAGFANFAARLRRHRDLLLVDVRGVGNSQGLECPDFEIPPADRFGSVFPRAHMEMCRNTLRERADLELYTTGLSVDDLEDLRLWLGYEQVNLTGGSYGTRVAQVWMRRHPEGIRTVILNSVAPVSIPGYVYMARSLQTSLDLVMEACVADAECTTENPDLRRRFERVLDRVDDGVELELEGEHVTLGRGDLSYALRGLLYGRASEVPSLIRRASEGDFETLARYYIQRTAWLAGDGSTAGYHFSALCAEDIAPLTDEQVARLSANTFMGDHLIQGYRDTCDMWDVASLPATFWEPVRSGLPVLIISGERDPVTPPEWGELVAEMLPNSLHIIVPGGGHGPGNDCTNSLEDRFLETASVEGLDPSCIS